MYLDIIELAGGKPALHPERKGQLDRSKLKNWVEKNGGLPTYINSVATAILRDNPSWSISRVIATAVNWAKKTCTTGKAFGGKVSVSKAVQKAACTAVKQWESKKAKASIEFDQYLLELSTEDVLKEEQWEARMRQSFRDVGEIPDLINMSDALYLRFLESDDYKTELVELSLDDLDSWEESVENTEAFMHVMELSAGAQSAIMTPMNMSQAQKVGERLYRKAILTTGEIIVDQNGNSFDFTPKFLKQLVENYKKNPVDYVPLLYTNDKDQHVMTAKPEYYGGVIKELSLDDDDNPTTLYATMDLEEQTAKLVEHNPKYGVSVTAHPNFVDYPRNTYYGPTLLNVAASHYPKMTKMGGWEKVSITASQEVQEYELINLSMNFKEGDSMATGDTQDKPIELSNELIADVLQSEAAKQAIADAVASATKAKDDQIVELSNQIGGIKNESYEQLVTAALSSYDNEGVPPFMRDCAKALLLSFGPEERDETIKLSTGTGDQKKELELNKVKLVTKMLDEAKGYINLSSEQGTEEDLGEEDKKAQRDAGVNFLLEMTGTPVASK